MKTNAIIQGFEGSGKTRSFLTLLPEWHDEQGVVHRGVGLETFVISMEPGHQAIFGSHGCKQDLHVHYLFPSGLSWDTVGNFARIINQNPMKDAMGYTDPKKQNYTGFMELFGICKSFTCDSCGKNFGNAAEWNEDRALCLDSLSPLSVMVMQNVVGGKPVPSQPEYFAAGGQLLAFLRLFFGMTKCSAILTAHIDREVDPVSGSIVHTMDTIGQRFAPQIRKLPDELITAYEDEGKYYWSNTPSRTGFTKVKHRRLPEGDTHQPEFMSIFAHEELPQ